MEYPLNEDYLGLSGGWICDVCGQFVRYDEQHDCPYAPYIPEADWSGGMEVQPLEMPFMFTCCGDLFPPQHNFCPHCGQLLTEKLQMTWG